MVCRVIKTIKGRQYLYEQRSYRVSGKVKTETRYLGAVDGLTGAAGVEAQMVKKTLETLNPKNDTEKPQAENNLASESPPKPEGLILHIKANFKKHKISKIRAQREYETFTLHLQNKGIIPDHIPNLLIGKASKVMLNKTAHDDYHVTLPRFKTKGTRTEFWRSFNKARAHQYLDALEWTDPKYFAGLEQNLTKYYDRQNKAIATYIMRSKRKEVFKMGLTLHFLYSKMVSTWTQSKLDPTLIGLSDYSSRSSWRDDTANLMAEVHNADWKSTYQKYSAELTRAENIQFSVFMKVQKMGFLDRLSGKRRATLKEWCKLDARRRAVYQACNKLSVLAPLYDGYPEPLQGSSLPFQHEQNWKATRMQWQEKLARWRKRKNKK